ncbi:DUF5107 domain-containing protein [Streptomyces sp. PT12]|uniref:DUF5107 domain-containing protein n=1 Tax=Streptomyces sp. PT12 TaxID=1510197 RepID=UPI000DE1B0B3|nr:DUF5107 domain-containing protein [Streptomyces sp. PT12]RBM20844.1 DUF5107 domain-containing protein [Streptomyces sp. PT12]
MARSATTIRRSTLTLPVAPLGPENPLPPLLPRDDPHRIDPRQRATLPPDMARQVGYAPLTSVLPTRLRDGYGRDRVPTDLDAIVLENDRLTVTVLPAYGGRVYAMRHKPTGRDLLYTNPVIQPADFALNGAWFSGGIEWNIGATGHTTLSCAPLHAAVLEGPGGAPTLRLWEWERLRDLPFQVDLWLPEGSDFLFAGVRLRNPHDVTVPVYWWSNTAVPETRHGRVLVPADEGWHFGYEHRLTPIPFPEWRGADRSYPLHGDFPADYFYEVPAESRKWIAAVDRDGNGLVQTSTATLRGRKLFVWGAGPGGRRWQRWLTEDGAPGYAEIQAGLARTQLEHVPLAAGGEVSWVECYGPMDADPTVVRGPDWAAARAHAEKRLAATLPEATVDAAYRAWLPLADRDPDEVLHTGSGWGALEVARGGYALPGTPFDPATLGPDQRPWLTLLDTGRFPEEDAAPERPPGPSLVAQPWRERLECAPGGPLTDYHLGVAQWHAGDRAQARRSWERSLSAAPSPWTSRCLALAEAWGGHPQRAIAGALAAAKRALATEGVDPVALAALARDMIPVLLDAGRADIARRVFDRLPREVRARGRFRLLDARILLALGDRAGARAIFDAGFEVADLREGDEVLSTTWALLTDDPLPAAYEFRMRPA